MLGVEVVLNGERVLTCGLETPGFLNAALALQFMPMLKGRPGVDGDFKTFAITKNKEVQSWRSFEISEGDEILLRVRDLESSDQPLNRIPFPDDDGSFTHNPSV